MQQPHDVVPYAMGLLLLIYLSVALSGAEKNTQAVQLHTAGDAWVTSRHVRVVDQLC